jgi:hypothetical protein
LRNWFSLEDRFGVHNFVAIPGIISGLAGVVATSVVDDYLTSSQVLQLFPARDDRSESKQALFQLASVGTSVGIAVVGGLIVGLIVSLFSRKDEKYSRDETEWNVHSKNPVTIGQHHGTDTVIVVN